jgi:hypothetical protein
MEQTARMTSMKRLAVLLMGCFIGAPLVAAPVLGQVSFRPLTIGHSLKVAQAYGPDDEDCIFVTRRVPRPNGLTHPSKSLVCNQ